MAQFTDFFPQPSTTNREVIAGGYSTVGNAADNTMLTVTLDGGGILTSTIMVGVTVDINGNGGTTVSQGRVTAVTPSPGAFTLMLNIPEAIAAGAVTVTVISTQFEEVVIASDGVIGDLTGNADTATVLETERDFSVSGDVSTATAVGFNGSSNVDISVTLDEGVVESNELGDLTSVAGTGLSWNNANKQFNLEALASGSTLFFASTVSQTETAAKAALVAAFNAADATNAGTNGGFTVPAAQTFGQGDLVLMQFNDSDNGDATTTESFIHIGASATAPANITVGDLVDITHAGDVVEALASMGGSIDVSAATGAVDISIADQGVTQAKLAGISANATEGMILSASATAGEFEFINADTGVGLYTAQEATDADTTVREYNIIIVLPAITAARTLTIPAVDPVIGSSIKISNLSRVPDGAGDFNWTISFGSQTIMGTTDTTLPLDDGTASFELVYTGSTWVIIGAN